MEGMQSHELDQQGAAAPRRVPRTRETATGTAADPSGGLSSLTPAALLHLQRLAGNESVNAMLAEEQEAAQERSPVHDVVGSGGGSPLEAGARSFMEERLGSDFSDVRIHTGGRADESARAISAQAYTVGTDVVFRSGTYQPETPSGQRVLAHELTHVVQQKAGPVAGTPAPGGIRISDPSDPFERAAEQAAESVMAAQRASGEAPAGLDEDEEEVQTMPIQRCGSGSCGCPPEERGGQDQ
jgi:hypothetical protein